VEPKRVELLYWPSYQSPLIVLCRFGHPGHHLLNCFTRGTKPFNLAVRLGFEPRERFHVRRFSKPVLSAAQPPHRIMWSPRTDSNRRHRHYKCRALPTELLGRYLFTLQIGQKSLLSSSNLHSEHLFIMIFINVYCFGKPSWT
jgi:hypothetical protein